MPDLQRQSCQEQAVTVLQKRPRDDSLFGCMIFQIDNQIFRDLSDMSRCILEIGIRYLKLGG